MSMAAPGALALTFKTTTERGREIREAGPLVSASCLIHILWITLTFLFHLVLSSPNPLTGTVSRAIDNLIS